MARYNHNIKGLFIEDSVASSIIESLDPLAKFKLEYLDEDGDVENTETRTYYRDGDDLIVVSDNEVDEGIQAYISGRTCYGTGEYTVRTDINKFINEERKDGKGLNIRVRGEYLPFDPGINLPKIIERE